MNWIAIGVERAAYLTTLYCHKIRGNPSLRITVRGVILFVLLLN